MLNGNVLMGGDGSAAIYTDANAYQNYSQYQNGVMSGRLVANLAAAQCGTDPNNASLLLYCD
jgi:hypothetical protein